MVTFTRTIEIANEWEVKLGRTSLPYPGQMLMDIEKIPGFKFTGRYKLRNEDMWVEIEYDRLMVIKEGWFFSEYGEVRVNEWIHEKDIHFNEVTEEIFECGGE